MCNCSNWYKNKQDEYFYRIIGSGRHIITGEKLTYYYGEDGEIFAMPINQFSEMFQLTNDNELYNLD